MGDITRDRFKVQTERGNKVADRLVAVGVESGRGLVRSARTPEVAQEFAWSMLFHQRH